MISVDQHNEAFQRGLVGFKKSLNKYADLDPDALKNIARGYDQPQTAMQGRLIMPTVDSLPKAPESFNWKDKGCVTPAKDQGYFCNNCWAFSALGALESQYLIWDKKNYSLSEQCLVDCNYNSQTGNFGCKGGAQSSAYEWIKKNGIELTDTYPYNEWLPHDDPFPCKFSSKRSVGGLYDYVRIRPRNENFLKDCVAYYGPCVIGFNGAMEDFMMYDSGVYDNANCASGLSHSAVVVGSGRETRADGKVIEYWICKNSWGSDWGEDGFFRILK